MKARKILFILMPLLISACASGPQAKSGEVPDAQSAKQDVPMEKVLPSTKTDASQDIPITPQQDLQKKSVYFDFDRFDIKPEYRDVIQRQAEFIKTYASSVTLEGNADERGSSEYNLALGNKRANSVKKMMAVLGVKNSQLDVASFGEEKPRLICHEERCWSENRRVDFNVKLGK